jgi:hypothetical protein
VSLRRKSAELNPALDMWCRFLTPPRSQVANTTQLLGGG